MDFGFAARGGIEREGENFRIRRLAVGAAEILNARLREFAVLAGAKAEHRPAIAEGGALLPPTAEAR